MPDARWNDPREYDDRDRGDRRPPSTASGTETITIRAIL
jgi:hypothetical protein